MNFVFGFFNKKDEEEDLIRIFFVGKEGMVNDLVIYFMDLEELVGEDVEVDKDCDG